MKVKDFWHFIPFKRKKRKKLDKKQTKRWV